MESIIKYETICTEIVLEFAKKQNINFDYWIGDIIGGIADLDSFTFDMQDMIYDLKTNQPIGNILEWQEYVIDYALNNEDKDYVLSYESYCKGFRF